LKNIYWCLSDVFDAESFHGRTRREPPVQNRKSAVTSQLGGKNAVKGMMSRNYQSSMTLSLRRITKNGDILLKTNYTIK